MAWSARTQAAQRQRRIRLRARTTAARLIGAWLPPHGFHHLSTLRPQSSVCPGVRGGGLENQFSPISAGWGSLRPARGRFANCAGLIARGKGGRVPMLSLPSNLQSIVEAEYPRFSADEMARRRGAVEHLLEATGADHLLYCGANRVGSVVQWLTQWPVTAEAVGVLSPGRRDDLFVQYFNHLPQARRLAEADVTWGGESSIRAAADALERRKARKGRVAAMGPLSAEQHAVLAERFGKIKSLNKDYVALRQIKSEEELDWLRIGAHLSDLGMLALRDGLKAGLSERELGDLIERAYVAHGGVNVIHYRGVTEMAAPRLAVPAQFPSTRKVQKGDVVFAEISTSFWDHPGQVLRTFALGAEPAPLYRELHAAADAAFDAIA